ncbi:cobalamin-binding protein [Ferrimonas lipolytica]|uniref:Cobalamin-binding protein n=1 Tax=Ferrimonas lipolytica TaxID=2724191 RepID=A0A6H1UBS8_9GAMM|nr:cobalamin-binding protein [Ferrimonas lipolytica]QIZ76494.1 cobalamin-binding protein [Ferrimonas lipolytica]
MRRANFVFIVVMLLSQSVLAAPIKIAALTPSSVELLFAVGAGDNIIATVEYADYPEQAQQIERVGSYDHFNMERLLLLQPDAVVVAFADTNQQLLGQLQMLRVPIIDSSVTELNQLPQRLVELAQLTDMPQHGEQLAQQFKRRLQHITEKYQHKPSVSVFYQVWPEPLTTVSSGWIDNMINRCGGRNVFAQSIADYPQVSLEQVIVRSPQLILLPVAASQYRSEVDLWSDWPELPAVKNEMMIEINADWVHRSGPRSLDGLEQICVAVDHARSVAKNESP